MTGDQPRTIRHGSDGVATEALTVERMTWTAGLVERFWAGVSRSRLSELSFSKHNSDQLIGMIRDYLRPDGRHLDFGAGEGDLVKKLLEQGYAAAAYEPVQGRLSRFPEEVLKHPRFLGLIDGGQHEGFDVVLVLEVIEHVLEEELAETLGRVRSLVAPGGVVVVSAPMNEDLDLSSAYCPKCESLFHRWQHVRSFTPERLRDTLCAHGFDCDALLTVDFTFNRLAVKDLRTLLAEIDRLNVRVLTSWDERIRRFLRLRNAYKQRNVELSSSLYENPSHILFIGRPRAG